MKTLKILTCLFFNVIIMSCSNTGSNTFANSQNTTEVQSTWKLVAISSFVIEASHVFTPGEVTWTFNNTTVTVVNNSGITDYNLPTGVYNYTIGQNSADNGAPCSEYLTIEGGQYGCIVIEGGQLSLASSNPDGFNYRFVK
jgi:hypothetical protein